MKILFLFIILSSSLISQENHLYRIYNSEGQEVSYGQMISELYSADVVFFGESHNNAVDHWLELELLKSFNEKFGSDNLAIGLEMFESDDQLKIDELFEGIIRLKDFEREAKLWNNYETDYKPLLTYSLDNKISFIATNIPRRYSSYLARNNFSVLDSISDEAKEFIADLPMEYDSSVEIYSEMKAMMGGGSMHGMPSIVEAQAIKDATMAKFIHLNIKNKFIHFNGSYHSLKHQGIIWYLKKLNDELKIKTIHCMAVENVNEINEDDLIKGDFIILSPENYPKTY